MLTHLYTMVPSVDMLKVVQDKGQKILTRDRWMVEILGGKSFSRLEFVNHMTWKIMNERNLEADSATQSASRMFSHWKKRNAIWSIDNRLT